MTNYFLPLEPDTYYHIFNRGNNGEKIFFKPENYLYFLKKFDVYVGNYLNVYAYALLPNHFHFLIKTKFTREVKEPYLHISSGKKLLETLGSILSEEFRRLFLSYAKAIKIQEGRTGSLFEKNFKRVNVAGDYHLLWLINYIHRNAETHGFIDDFRKWRFSCYSSFVSTLPTKLCREEVLQWFGGRAEFARFHLSNPVNKEAAPLLLE